MTARDDLEDAVRDQLQRACDITVAYCASRLVTPGVPFPYPEADAGAEAVLAVFDAAVAGAAFPPAPRLLTVKEVADAGRVSRAAVYRAIRMKDLPAVRVGTRWRVTEREARRYLGAHRRTGGRR